MLAAEFLGAASLLEAVGGAGKPVLLKRGPSASLDELLLAAEYILNAGKSEVKGAELELEAALTERFTAGFSYSYVNAEFVQLDDAEALNLFGNASVAGNHPAGVPENQASVFGRYEFELGSATKAFVRADASYTSEKYNQIFNLASTGGGSAEGWRGGCTMAAC